LAEKKVVREGNDILIVIGSIIVIRPSRECICSISRASNVFEFKVILGEIVNVLRHTTQNLLWVVVVSKVRMVDEDLNGEKCSSE
jgi:hypothetical protein